MSRGFRCIHKTDIGGWEIEGKESAKDEEEKEGAEERAVKEARERPSHEGEKEGGKSRYINIAERKAKTRPEKGEVICGLAHSQSPRAQNSVHRDHIQITKWRPPSLSRPSWHRTRIHGYFD